MSVLVHDCPHCASQHTAFTVRGWYQHDSDAGFMSVTASCNACNFPVVVVMRVAELFDPIKSPHELGRVPGTAIQRIYPMTPPVEVPGHVPTAVAAAFKEAASNRRDRRYTSACAMYRRAMEGALKELAPDIDTWKLEKRIDKLALEHRITPDLQAWAHSLRLDGNEVLHGQAVADTDLTDQMHHLCWFLLMYLYTLPKQVQAALESRADRAKLAG
jgi:hypothetical protein